MPSSGPGPTCLDGRRPDRLRGRPRRLRAPSRPRGRVPSGTANPVGSRQPRPLGAGAGAGRRGRVRRGNPQPRDAGIPRDLALRSGLRGGRADRRGRPRLSLQRHGVRHPADPSAGRPQDGYLARPELRLPRGRPYPPAHVVSQPGGRAGGQSRLARVDAGGRYVADLRRGRHGRRSR